MLPNIRSQRKQVFDLLNSTNPDGLTRMQISKCLGVERASICRRVAELRDKGVLWVVKRGLDPITGERAEFLTTNKNVAMSLPIEAQPEKTGMLFE